MTVYVLEQSMPYEGSSIIDVFTDKEVAEATAEVYRAADRGYTYSVDEYTPQTVVPHVNTWWEANAHRSTEDPPTVRAWQLTEVSFDPAPEPYMTLTNGRMQKPNPGYIRDTPNARIPDTPGGRYRTIPSRSVHVIEATEELAMARALLELGTDPL